MKAIKHFFLATTALFALTASGSLAAADLTQDIPELTVSVEGFNRIPDVAQYKMADWSQVVGIARQVSLKEVQEILKQHPEVTFFFYTKGGQMVLETEDGNYRVFRHGDAVFFTGQPWWGSAPGLADGYIRIAE